MSDVTISGPWFDERGTIAIRDYLDWAQGEVATQGLADVHTNLEETIRHPTPYYETQVNIRREDLDLVVNDRDIVYGPWLEGTGSRNFPKTRFPGYANWRRARQQLAGEVHDLIEPIPERFITRMGGI